MVRIRENKQKQLINRIADAGLLRTDQMLSTLIMFICIINVICVMPCAP